MTHTVKRVLLTGAAGRLGQMLRERLAGSFELLRLSDRRDMAPAGPGEEVVVCDLADASATAAICQGVDAIVHMGGIPNDQPWPTLVEGNLTGAINLWEGARMAGVGRVLFASSNHAIGLYRRTQTIDHAVHPRPDSRYGLTKAFGEDLAKLYAFKHGVRGYCMRIGGCTPRPVDARALSTWLSPDDLARLVRTGLEADYLFEIVYGVSANRRAWWDNTNAHRLGYRPKDDAEVFAAELEDKTSGNALNETFQGGIFAEREFTGDPDAIS
ncbi:NAD-dependent epimerase/dehydratase family protein [Marinivivus vitaminiproducens]|uniref:NAD-dependent epimerase/dehydratase family protein n=1 Tax=Marinivivus vitaminiproducens TaxID=3035935 RepID=UPI0027A5DC87|nr:NAD(P)-dependent oxidoreductase [Geminicoccaceae bacterium SCSIO 64248]